MWALAVKRRSRVFGKLFKKKEYVEPQFIVANLNARIMPLDRGDLFEDPLDDQLSKLSLGEVTGGGTLQSESGEIEYCDIEIQVNNSNEETIQAIKTKLEELGAPKGSKLIIESTEKEVPIGLSEGLAVYLNGTDLPDDVYKECDSDFIFSEFNRLLDKAGAVLSHWQGPTETALYLYGNSSDQMHDLINEFLATYPMCQKCRVEKIA
ncbi:MAG: hypothetical protein ACJAW8_000607 [Oleispira sp.]|jgi:hypothetical protein